MPFQKDFLDPILEGMTSQELHKSTIMLLRNSFRNNKRLSAIEFGSNLAILRKSLADSWQVKGELALLISAMFHEMVLTSLKF